MSDAAGPEYPKMLYRDGAAYDEETGRLVPHQFTTIVGSAEEEAAAGDTGYVPVELPVAAEEPVEEAPPQEEPPVEEAPPEEPAPPTNPFEAAAQAASQG